MNYRPIYRSFKFLLKSRQYSTKVPLTPNTTLEKDVNKETVTVNESTIALLERLSLVKFDTKDGVKVLEDSINFANKILHIDTDGVEPLYTVLEKENVSLREDKVTQGNCQADILKNAMVIEDDYFVAPPGNIPLHEVECEEKQTSIKNECRNQKDSKQMKDDKKVPYGIMEPILIPNKFELKENDNDYNILTPTKLKLHLVYPKQDIMQYFIKWQRYRKYWWSSITTTPSLFLINDMKQEDNIINVNITANFPWGQQVVESIKLNTDKSDKSCLVCKLGLETALLTIMLDAASNGTKEGYVRLHNKLAPYKFSFAFNLQDTQQNQTMVDLAKLINYKLALKKISTWLPEFSVDLEDQIKENLQLGIPYTILLDDLTLKNGILHLMNSSTMLKEQIHVADLESYAQILCKN